MLVSRNLIHATITLSVSEWRSLRDLLQGACNHPDLVQKIDGMLKIYHENKNEILKNT